MFILSASAAALTQEAPEAGSFGASPSGQIPIFFNDHHVYAKPDALKQGRVLAPLVNGGTVLIPLRSMFEQMGASVSYDTGSNTVDVSKPSADVKLTIGKADVVINGEPRPLDVAPIMWQGNILIPIRLIAESMGAYVEWVPNKHIVVVRYIPPTPPPPVLAATGTPPPPATAAPTPTPTAGPRSIDHSTLEVYNSHHPETNHPYFGRYSYVLLSVGPSSSLNKALLEALLSRTYAPSNGLIKPGVAVNPTNPLDFSVFEIPVKDNFYDNGNDANTAAEAASLILKYYDFNRAGLIRDSYCKVPQHAAFAGICGHPEDPGPVIITFFAPAELLRTPRPAFAYDFAGAPADSMLLASALDAIQVEIDVPENITADHPMPPIQQLEAAQVLWGVNAGLKAGASGVRTFAEGLASVQKLLSPDQSSGSSPQ